MAHSFVAYIDEAGDQGFKFNDDPGKPGSKRWFVLTAVIVSVANDPKLIRCVADLRVKLRLQERQPIHFSQLTHAQKVLAVHEIAEMPVRIINVMVEKERLSSPEVFSGAGFRLYFYTMRLLLERISWLCRDAKEPGACRLVFERCKGLNYDALGEYIDTLRTKGSDPFFEEPINIAWEFLDLPKLKIEDKNLIGALQIADSVRHRCNGRSRNDMDT